jgi:hypothetical protein
MTQQEKLLNRLVDGKFHSSLEIRNELFIMSSAGVVFQAKKDGYDIETKMMPYNPSDKNSTPIAWYRWVPKQDRLFDAPRMEF